MKKRWLLVFVAAITVPALFAAFLRDKSPPQRITLPNGERYRFIAAVWGVRQVPPTIAARLLSHFPPSVSKLIPQRLANRVGPVFPITTPQPSLRLWFRLQGTNDLQQPPSVFGLLEDEQGVPSGDCGYPRVATLGNVTWLMMTFQIVPRRSAFVECRLFDASANSRNPRNQFAHVRFSNPVFGKFPQWQPETTPETLPATKASGDIRVRLTEFTIGAENDRSVIVTNEGKMTRFHDPGPGEWREPVFKLAIETPHGTNIEPWIIQRAELSDATGNRVSTDSSSRWSITHEYHFGPALWPDEAAWRLTLDVERNREFDSEELVTFTSVPVPAVGATNIVYRTNSIHGVPVILKQEFTRDLASTMSPGEPALPPTHLLIELLNRPEGVVVDFFRLKSDTGWTQTHWYNKRATNCTTLYLYDFPRNVRTMDLTWAIQKKRTVEFLIKPPQMK